MDLTSKGLAKAKCTKEKSLAKAKNSRGLSAKACAAKAVTWEIESARALPIHDVTKSKASLS